MYPAWRKFTVVLLLVMGTPTLFLANVFAGIGDVEKSGARRIRWVVKVTADPNIIPLDGRTVAALLRSDAVLGEATRSAQRAGSNRQVPSFDCETLTAEPHSGPLGRTVVVTLDIDLPGAHEFGKGLVAGLRLELRRAYDAHERELRARLEQARSEQESARAAYDKAIEEATPEDEPIQLDPADQVIYDQLAEKVDLSKLSLDMPFAEAIEVLKNSVEPPLPIVVLWNDLLDNADIEPHSPIRMDPLPALSLGAGLQKLLDAVAGGFADLDYMVDDGAVTVATIDGLRAKQMETRVHRVPFVLRTMGQEQLVRTIQETVEPESWFEQSEFGEGTIIAPDDTRLVVWQSRTIHKEVQALLYELAKDAPVALPVEAPTETLDEQLHALQAYRDELEAKLDKLQERLATLEQRRRERDKRLIQNSWEDISRELWIIVSDLQRIEEDPADTPQSEPLAHVILKLEQCLEKHSKTTPAWNPPFFDLGPPWPRSDGGPESHIVSERINTGQKALRDVRVRIDEIQRTLLGQKDFDPQVEALRLTARRLDRAAARVNDLQRRLAILVPPRVTVLGAGD